MQIIWFFSSLLNKCALHCTGTRHKSQIKWSLKMWQCSRDFSNFSRLCIDTGMKLTFFFFGVQLCDADGEPVHPLLQGVDPEREGVGFIEKLSKKVLCIFTCKHTRVKEIILLFQRFQNKMVRNILLEDMSSYLVCEATACCLNQYLAFTLLFKVNHFAFVEHFCLNVTVSYGYCQLTLETLVLCNTYCGPVGKTTQMLLSNTIKASHAALHLSQPFTEIWRNKWRLGVSVVEQANFECLELWCRQVC